MAVICPVGFDANKLRQRVRGEYNRLAGEPEEHFHFHRGPEYACRMLRYNPAELATIPTGSTASFTGVGNPHRIGAIVPGETILDVGCGSGMDLLLVAGQTGSSGRAIGIDMTPAMIERAKCAALKTGVWQNVEIRRGTAEELAVGSGTIDVVISNGVVNLTADKRRVFSEIYRVLRPGGRLYLADVVLQRELSLATRSDINLWIIGIGGALLEVELYELSQSIGFAEGKVVERFDCYEGTLAKAKLAKDLYAQGVNFFARKPVSIQESF